MTRSIMLKMVLRTPHYALCLIKTPRYALRHAMPCNAGNPKQVLVHALYVDTARSLYPLLFLTALPVAPPTSFTTPMPSTATLLSCTVPPSFLIICSLALAAPGESQPSS